MSQEFPIGLGQIEHVGEENKEELFELLLGKVKFCLKIESTINERKRKFRVKSCELKNQVGASIELTEFLKSEWKLILDPDLPSAFAKADLLNQEMRLPVYSFTEHEYKVSPGQELPLDEIVKRDLPIGSFWDRRKTFVRLRTVKETHCMPFFERPEFLLTFLHELGHTRHPNNQDLPEDYSQREHFLANRQVSEKDQQQEEIDCWNEGLANFHDIESRGFYFGEQLNKERVKKHVLNSLKTYGVEDEGLIRFIS